LKAYLPIHDLLVSNLPYKITEAFFQRTLRLKFKTATFIVPKRFSKTLIAKQSEQEYSKLSWLSQLFYNSTQHENVSPKAYLPEPKIQTTIITLKPKKDITEVEKTLKELVRQGDKYTKNALREALIKSEICSTKRKARKYINDLNIEQRTLQSRASRLSLHDLQTIEEKITGEPYIQSA
jgi:16S rRNA (adenine1518-N6/adenine1519-N6)-dimethyltransferase